MKKTLVILSTIVMIASFTSCNEKTAMTGTAAAPKATPNTLPVKKAVEPIDTTDVGSGQGQPPDLSVSVSSNKAEPIFRIPLSLTCGQIAQTQTTPVEIHRKASQDVEITLTGEMCAEVPNDLTILFVVDWSASMQYNDPRVGLGSCGRYKAAKAIMDYIGSKKQNSDNIKVGFIGFSDQAYGAVMQDFATFTNYTLNGSKFCMAQQPTGPQGGTNYYAAFQKAESLLSKITQGPKIVYFISDGGPTIRKDGSFNPNMQASGLKLDPQAATDGIESATSLRNHIPNLTVNGLLLGNDGAQARQTLVDAIGSNENVRTANNASQLAAEILKFPEVALIQNSLDIKLQVVAINSNEGVKIKSFSKKNDVRNTWIYTLEPTLITGNYKQDGFRNFIVTAKDANNKIYSSTIYLKIITDR